MQRNEDIIKLLPKKKKGVLRFLFSRLFIVIFLMIIQVLIFLALYSWLKELLPYFTLFQAVFSIGMILFLFNCGMDSSAKLTWLAIIMLFPLPGTMLLWYTQNNFGYKATGMVINRLIEQTSDKLKTRDEVLSDPDVIASATDDLCRYLNRTGCFPLCGNTQVTYFPLGEDKFEAMLRELQKAEHFIFMEYFIIGEGYMWGRLLSVLKEKAEQGVEVRVMFDGMCEMSTLSFDYPERMQKLGIKCKAFAPIKPFVSTHYNYRDHRKILVIDNKVAFNGGVNIADEYINKTVRFGHWKDTAIMLEGEAVSSFTLMFLQMWNVTEREHEWDKYLAVPEETVQANGYVMPYGDIPLDDDRAGENVYIDILNRSSSYVHVMTPYLILDNELENALKFAAQRGVDVRLILPGIPDKNSAYALAKSHYKTLIDAGVKLYEYTPGFVHAKVFVCDDIKAVVGTINLDYRSLYHHFECATYMYKTDCIADIEKDFRQTLEKCTEVTHETIKNERLYYKLMGGLLKVFAPLM